MEKMAKSKALEKVQRLRSNLCRELEVREGISAPVPPSFLAMSQTTMELLYIIELVIRENVERQG